MNPPLTGLVASAAVEAALEYAPNQRIHHHAEETYQRSHRDDSSPARCQCAGSGNNESSYCRSDESCQGDATAGARHDRSTRPHQSGRHLAVEADGGCPGIGRRSGKAGGYQPELQGDVARYNCRQCGRPPVGVHLPGVSSVAFGIQARAGSRCSNARDEITGNKKGGQNGATFPSGSMKYESAHCPCRNRTGLREGAGVPGYPCDTRADCGRQRE